MAKAFCPKCRKMLTQVLSSFECLSTWNKAEEYYAPEEDCKLVRRCPDCGTLAKEKGKRLERPSSGKKSYNQYLSKRENRSGTR